MKRYLLDTDTLSYALRGVGNVAATLAAHARQEVCMSAVSVAELRYGADLRRSRKLHRLIDELVRAISALPFDGPAATRYGSVAAHLARAGTPIGIPDTMIAAHALELELTLVTHNAKHFDRVSGLRTEDWT